MSISVLTSTPPKITSRPGNYLGEHRPTPLAHHIPHLNACPHALAKTPLRGKTFQPRPGVLHWRHTANSNFFEDCSMPRIKELHVNGKPIPIDADSERTLLSVLRDDLELTGAKYGCGEGE